MQAFLEKRNISELQNSDIKTDDFKGKVGPLRLSILFLTLLLITI